MSGVEFVSNLVLAFHGQYISSQDTLPRHAVGRAQSQDAVVGTAPQLTRDCAWPTHCSPGPCSQTSLPSQSHPFSSIRPIHKRDHVSMIVCTPFQATSRPQACPNHSSDTTTAPLQAVPLLSKSFAPKHKSGANKQKMGVEGEGDGWRVLTLQPSHFINPSFVVLLVGPPRPVVAGWSVPHRADAWQ